MHGRVVARVLWVSILASGCGGAGLPPEAIEHNGAGAEHLAQGRLDDAEASFHLALEYHPRFSEPRANLGAVALQRGDLDRAERHLDGAIELRPDFAEAWGNLGVVYERQGRDDAARSAYERALSIDPGLVAPRRNLAFLLGRTGDWTSARAQLMRFVQLQPDDHEAQSMLALCDHHLGRFRDAFNRADEVIGESSELALARLVRGLGHHRLGLLDRALDDYSHAVSDPVVGPKARFGVLAIHIVRRDGQTAYPLARAAVDEHPGEARSHLALASASLLTERFDEARDEAVLALRLAPNLGAAHAVLRNACERAPGNGCPGD